MTRDPIHRHPHLATLAVAAYLGHPLVPRFLTGREGMTSFRGMGQTAWVDAGGWEGGGGDGGGGA